MKKNRRNALKTMSALGLSALASGLPAKTSLDSLASEKTSMEVVKRTILFQGDSITDAGRSRAHYYPNQGQGMGQGYVRHIVTELMGRHPLQELTFYNRGISGNKVFQLRDRWEDDCIQLKPDILSIMIGVNDFWHTLDNGYKGTGATYAADLDALLTSTKKKLPYTRLIICEPFVCLDGTAIKPDLWRGAFEEYQAACHEVAQRHKALYVPYQQVFDDALKEAPASYWCPDGVHPSMAGNYLMAQAWLKAYETL